MLEKNLILIPTYNEARNLEGLVKQIRAIDSSDILIVDDNSPDGTGAIADQIAQSMTGVAVVHREGKQGLGTAHVRGMEWAVEKGYATFLTMDCDFTHPPQYIPSLRKALEERSADLIIGSRYIKVDGISEWPMWRRAVTRTADFLTTILLGLNFDSTNALRIYRVKKLDLSWIREIKADGYSFMFELLFHCKRNGFQIDQIPVHLPIRQAGESKISKKEIFKAIRSLGRLALTRFFGKKKAPSAEYSVAR